MVIGRILKFSFLALAVVALSAGSSALADELIPYSGLTEKHIIVFDDMSTIEVEPSDGSGSALGTYYSNMDAGSDFLAFPAATGIVGLDDYTSAGVPAGDTHIELTEFKFVGGVEDVDGIAFFDFLDTDNNLVDSFGVAFELPGPFIYTITIGGSVIVPKDGFVVMDVDVASNPTGGGQFFLSDAIATIGTTADDPPLLEDGGRPLNHKFEITGDSRIPEPSSMLPALTGWLGSFRRPTAVRVQSLRGSSAAPGGPTIQIQRNPASPEKPVFFCGWGFRLL